MKNCKTTSDLTFFVNFLNYMLAKNIKTNKKSSKLKKFIIQVNDSVFDHLKEKFKLNGRFKICESFIDYFNLIHFDFLNSTDVNEIDKLSVQLRLHHKRKINIHDSKNNLYEVTSPKFLTIKFLVIENKRKV